MNICTHAIFGRGEEDSDREREKSWSVRLVWKKELVHLVSLNLESNHFFNR